MILLLIGLLDSLPPIPDPFVFKIESLPNPQIQRLTDRYSLHAFLGNPLGGRFTHRSLHSDADLYYEKGEDWIQYVDTKAKGSILIPAKKTLLKIGGCYQYLTRNDTLSYFRSGFSLTGIDRFIIQTKGEIIYNSISDTTANEYNIETGLIFNRIKFIPQIKVCKTRSAFSDLWGINIGSSLPPITIIGEYTDNLPGIDVRFDQSFKDARLVIEVDRTTAPLFVSDIVNLPPIRFSDSITTPRKKVESSICVMTIYMNIGINYQLWDSFPVPGDTSLYGTMSPATDIYGYATVTKTSPIDSVSLTVCHSDRRYQPRISGNLIISALRYLSVRIGLEDYQNFRSINPGLSLKLGNLNITCDYFPSENEIYPNYYLKKRLSILAKWQSSFR